MAAGQVTIYSANKDDLRLADLLGATVKLMLVTSAYTPDTAVAGHSVLADASANEIAAGNGYTAGGLTLTTLSVDAIAGGWKFDSDDAVWTASGGNIPAWRYGVLYVSGALWGKTNPLLAEFLGDATPADVPATTDGNPLTVSAPAGGWFDIT